MARIRYIKPEFFTDENIVELDFASRLLFVGLWTLVDREGRMEYSPKQVKIRLFPTDRIDIEAKVRTLAEKKRITLYEVGGKRYIEIPNFAKHQRPHPKEAASCCPPPEFHGKQFNYTASPSEREGEGERNGEGNEDNAPGDDLAWIDDPAVTSYRNHFKGFELSIPDQELIIRRATDQKAWNDALDFWQSNKYRERSIGKMLDKHDEILKERTNGTTSKFGKRTDQQTIEESADFYDNWNH